MDFGRTVRDIDGRRNYVGCLSALYFLRFAPIMVIRRRGSTYQYQTKNDPYLDRAPRETMAKGLMNLYLVPSALTAILH